MPQFRFVLLAWLCIANLQAWAQSNVREAGIQALQTELGNGSLTSVMLVDEYLQRIAANDDEGAQLNAILYINPQAREQARLLDEERRRSGPRSLLHGIPVVIKDNYSTVNMPTTGASRSLEDFIPNRNATQVEKLLEAGAIILAKTNLHEFAYGITTISSLGGQTRNPYDPARVPGGSSGGTAAAVAAGFAAVGMGSDTCGSIRIPAAFNNLVGLRPTKGLSSIHGIMPLAHTQDVAGPLARSIDDLAIVLDLTIGFDPNDEHTLLMQGREPLHFREQLGSVPLEGLRVGRLTDYMDAADPQIGAVLEQTLSLLEEHGVEVIDISIPELGRLIAESGVIGHEFEADLDAYLQAFGSESPGSLEEIVAGGEFHEAVAMLLSRSAAGEQDAKRYRAALQARDVLKQAIRSVMQTHELDVIAYPPIAALPVLIGESQPGNNCSLSGNSGFPALSLPAGFTADGLPVGLELLGKELDDARLLSIGHAIERINPQRRPPPL